MRHVNIPIFIPHLGCPNQCIFCNQRYISGTVDFDVTQVRALIEETLCTVADGDTCEIAFFGGSFTGIDRTLMIELLDIAEEYVRAGKIIGTRMSTRPDYISEEIIEILNGYTITCVELGIQSMNDEVLTYLKRGHTVQDTVNAANLLKSNGYGFVGQMMIGLPTSTSQDEIYCADMICRLGAFAARIYPTVVFRKTELEELTCNGEYIPLTLEEAVNRAADVLRVFNNNNVECIRIGLCDSENLHSDATYVDGPNSPSIGEMVLSRLYFTNICEMIDKSSCMTEKMNLLLRCSKGKTSQVIGHRKKNILELKNRYGFSKISVFEDAKLEDKELKLEMKEENSCV